MANRIGLRQAALFAWVFELHRAAERACQQVGYEGPDSSGEFIAIIEKIRTLIADVNQITGAETPDRLRSSQGGCTDDDGCPGGQICVYSHCESPFPSYFVSPGANPQE